MQDGVQDKVNILLVDDQPARLLSYETILRELGQNLTSARSGPEALEKLMREDFALILLDVSMPGMDGFETAAMIHDHPRFEKTPIIFVTGVHDSEFDRLKGYKLGAVDYVSIPVVPEILRSKVAVLVELHCKRRDLQKLNRTLEAANRGLADANLALQAEKTRELTALNHDLQVANAGLQRSNAALQAEIAERIRVETALVEGDRRKDEFLAILAHELRNPLAALDAAARLLGRQDAKPDIARMAAEALKRQVQHMARLLDDLLDVARISNGLMHLRMDRVEVTAIASAAVETIRPHTQEKQQSLTLNLGTEAAWVAGDAVRINQIISNLLNNAMKYTPAGGHIELDLAVEAGRVRLAVRDNGIGIEPQMLDRVFEMFLQVGKPPGGSQAGLGIGLALVKGLVSLHAGSIEAHSEGEGKGSVFTVYLPLHPETGTGAWMPESAEGASEALEPLRVLVADDNMDSANSWSALLTEYGHEVCTAYEGRAALDKAQEFLPQVALLDIGMPSLDGYEVAKSIRSSSWGRNVFLVAITGWGQARDRALAFQAGFDRHFTKPVDIEQLHGVLREANRKLRG